MSAPRRGPRQAEVRTVRSPGASRGWLDAWRILPGLASHHRLQLSAAPGDVARAGRGDLDIRDLRGRWPRARHGRAMHDPAITALVPGPAAMQDTTIVPHQQIARPPAVRVDERWRRRPVEQVADQRAGL